MTFQDACIASTVMPCPAIAFPGLQYVDSYCSCLIPPSLYRIIRFLLVLLKATFSTFFISLCCVSAQLDRMSPTNHSLNGESKAAEEAGRGKRS
jgi:hypothetical protein